MTIIHAFVTSKLDYCNSLLSGITDELLAKLQKIQNTAARIVTKTRKFEHITPVLKKLHWLPMRQRIQFKILLVTYKALNDKAPSYIRDLLHPYEPTRSLRSSCKNLLSVPVTRLKTFGDRAFEKVAPKLWNGLPESIRLCKSVDSFKKQLKSHLMNTAYHV